MRFVLDIPVQTVPDTVPAVVILVLYDRQDFASDPVSFVRVEPGFFRRLFAAGVNDDFLKTAQASYPIFYAALPFLSC